MSVLSPFSPFAEALPSAIVAHTSVHELEEGKCSSGPALRLWGCIQQHAECRACQQPHILAQGLDTENKCTSLASMHYVGNYRVSI